MTPKQDNITPLQLLAWTFALFIAITFVQLLFTDGMAH